MELHAFGHHMRDKVRAFEKYWREGMKDDAEVFPHVNSVGDWEEQFQAFLEINS